MASADGPPQRLPALPYLAVVGLASFCHAALLLAYLPTRLAAASGTVPQAFAPAGAVYLLLSLGGRLPAGWLLRNASPRPALLYSLAAGAVSFALLGNLSLTPLVLLAAALHALSAAAIWPAALAGLGEAAGEADPRQTLRWLYGTALTGAALGVAAGQALLAGGPGMLVAALMAVWVLSVLAALTGLPERPAGAPAPPSLSARGLGKAWREAGEPTGSLLSAGLQAAGAGAVLVSLPAWAGQVADTTPFRPALAMLIAGAVGLVAWGVAGRWSAGRRAAVTRAAGLALAALGLAGLAATHMTWAALWLAALAAAGGSAAVVAWAGAMPPPSCSAGWRETALVVATVEGGGGAIGACVAALLSVAASAAGGLYPGAALLLLAAIAGVFEAWRTARAAT